MWITSCKNGEVVIVDEFTGRLMVGRRYSDGLHQAIEAKEHVKVQRESKTLATITFQNYFRMYSKLSGMTGTAKTEEEEFKGIYKLDVVQIPTNRPMIRKDMNDLVYTHAKGQVQPGDRGNRNAATRRASRFWSARFPSRSARCCPRCCSMRGIEHVVLNAKYHATRGGNRRAGRSRSARSPSPPTWRAAARISCWAATRSSSPAAR